MPHLAIKGGEPIRKELFPAYNTIGKEEKEAVQKVLDTGNLSQFLGAWTPDFFGGPTVRKLEEDWCQALSVGYAISVNSNTSGLFAAVGACGIQPGDEVIVSPYTMSASAIAPIVYGGVPIFADIDPDTFCMDPKSIEAKITPRTKAILVVHIFGHPADMDTIMQLAKKHNLKVIEDCAQAPMGMYKGKYVGTIGDLGVFSLNYHKHIHTGEGGIVVTNDPILAERIQLIRNHGENIVEAKGITDLTNMIGFNYRMTEIEAAIGIEQLKKLPALLEERLKNAAFLHEAIGSINGLVSPPKVKSPSVHTYYVQPVKYNQSVFEVHRNDFVNAVKAEIPSAVLRETAPLIGAGYVRPLYLQPIYQQRAAFAFNNEKFKSDVNYSKGLCPVTEQMHYSELITHEYMRPGMSRKDMEDVVRAFEKVAKHIDELKINAAVAG
ncbi:DegT/DnrJ/EryC1/StrS aminotransferase [Rufibacter radiotolerans]|uniref:DegT/DnrJ/EryC1/StrS aminotransferase n=1 Tax=Rufibacter radiotolerans TaxID=1379910 RepID=A0A0H4VM18_9BACT|nr:DegT/DnrJ/EryC1/StrS family aminotransferase [Rufibacter radiotolerans]AKQ44789.1 DegT/DnrJ/EryC1/StrS aminotransferase [Rufibacter radiotolerans]